MTLNTFLALVLSLLIVIVVAFYRPNKFSKSPIPYFIALALAMMGSYWAFIHYAKSQGGYYKNTDYHIIEQEGFKYPKGQSLMLVSDVHPEKAFLATGLGELELDGEGCLVSSGFKLPIYVEDEPMNFRVANLTDELSMGNGDQIELKKDGVNLLTIKYEEKLEHNKIVGYRFMFAVANMKADTVEKSNFRQGYNLVDLLQEGSSTRLDVKMQEKLRNCYLMRRNYKLDVVKPDKASGKVYLFGVSQMADDVEAYRNGMPVSYLDGDVNREPMDGRQFFFGLGATRSQVYQVTTSANDIRVTYRLPRMYHFPSEGIKGGEVKMFLTTDKQEIVDRRGSFDCFYQFADQSAYNSIYKASAAMKFMIENAGVDLNPQIGDVYDEANQNLMTPVTVGEPFEVKTLSCGMDDGSAQVSHLFCIRDMRRNVVYNHVPKLYGWMLFLLLVIYLMLHYMKDNNGNRMNKFYIVETSVYLTLIAFLTVRLVILWRLHAFPPIENVSRLELDTLTSPQNYYWTFIAIIAVLVIRMLVLLLQWVLRAKTDGINGWVGDLFDKMDQTTIPFKRNYVEMPVKWVVALVLPFVVYLACFFLSKASVSLEVLVKEAILPIVAFVVNSLYYVYRIKVEPNNRTEFRRRGTFCWLSIFWNMLVFFFFVRVPFHENGLVFPMIGVFAAWLFIVILVTPVSHRWFKWVLFAGTVLGLIVVFWHVPLAQTPVGKKLVSRIPDGRIKARIVATSLSPSEMVQSENVEFKDKSMQDILNASSNKWYIDNHLAQRYYLAKNKGDFILNKEFNQRAVNYTTQTRDVVLLRYVIFEHGAGVVKKLLCILLCLTFIVFAMYERKGRYLTFLLQVPLQSSLFLLMFSSYLYLVNLNAVVFVGLDFPFLTLTSKVAPFGLLLPLLAILLPMNIKKLDESLVGSTDGSPMPDKQKAIVGVAASLMMIGLVVLPSRLMYRQIKKSNGQSLASFSISMEPLAEFVNDYMNPKFKEYQEQTPQTAKRFENMSVYNPGLKEELRSYIFGSEDGMSMGVIDGLLNEYVGKTGRKNDGTFIRSAFVKFFNTPLTNTSNIISIKKQSGRFIFVTNKVYYDMKPMFKNNSLLDWHGDMLGAASVSRLTFMGENRKESIELESGYYVYGSRGDAKNVDKLKSQYLGVNNNGDINFNIVQIPQDYCYQPALDGHDVFLLYPIDAKTTKNYVIYPSGDFTNPITIKESNTAMWIKPNDVVKVSGQKQYFSFKTEDEHYFAKRIHFNGKHQVVYPLRDRFVFAYNLDQMLAETYHPKDSSDQPVRISLDYQLLNDVYDYCESEMGHKKAYGEGVTVTAIDGYGRIRLLADYNPRHGASFDPNNAKELREKMEDIYLNGNRKEERAMLQNRNLARMTVGPGSTIKVPFYVAIASKTHLDWTKFGISFPSSSVAYKDNQAVVGKYGNYITKGIHKGYDGWDEMSLEYKSGQTMGSSAFITTSNNFFFGSIIGLATYSPTALINGLEGPLVEAEANEAVFPKFSMDGRYYKFKDNFVDDFDDARALESGLEDNFGFPRYQNSDFDNQLFDVSPTDAFYGNDKSKSPSSRMRSMNSEYVYSERPNVHRDIRSTTPDEVIKGFFHLTSGGAKLLDVSPLNMAEMYLRIATLNSADNLLTYSDAVDSIPSKPFVTVHGNDFAALMQNTTFIGMWNIFTEAGGTLINSTDRNQREKLSNQNNPIYLYGKTGTVGAETQDYDNKHYAFILSNQRLDQAVDHATLKTYVVYFGYYDTSLGKGHSATAPSRKVILDKIIESETFQNYWNEKTTKTIQ